MVFGLIKKVPVFDVFISGAKEGVKLLYNIAPTIMGLVFAVDLLQSSGAIDAICALIQPTGKTDDDFRGGYTADREEYSRIKEKMIAI